MKTSAIARCTLANEIFRHRNQTECSEAVCARPIRNVEPRTRVIVFWEEIPQARSLSKQRFERRSAHSTVSTCKAAEEKPGRDPASSPTAVPDSPEPSSVSPYWKPIMWRPGLNAIDQNSAVFAASQRGDRGTRRPPSIQTAPIYTLGDLDRDKPHTTRSRRPSLLEGGPLHSVFHFSDMEKTLEDLGPYDDIVHTKIPFSGLDNPSNSVSPTSDVTIFEEPMSMSRGKVIEEMDAYSSYDELEKCIKLDTDPHTPSPRRRMHSQRNSANDSLLSMTRSPTTPFRARAKTNDGMLELKINSASKELTPYLLSESRHRRKMSLNLPVKSPSSPAGSIGSPPINSRGKELIPRTSGSRSILSSEITQQERELAYKHRHTFIGTASLDDFLELLDVSDQYETTKEAIAKAFILLSSNEQLYARQCSTTHEGWELVYKVTPNVKDIDYLAQLQVKLGSISLRQFLDLIPFDEHEQVHTLRCVEAFSAASHLDSKAGVGTDSKARAFRDWMLLQKDRRS